MKKILFVCTGNSCRSVMAEGLLKQLVSSRPDVQVASAGISAVDGYPATQETVHAMRGLGVDVSRHKSRRLTDAMVHEADKIFVMEMAHRDWILNLAPGAAHKVALLTEYADDEGYVKKFMDVPDPIRMSDNFYKNVLTVIQTCVRNIAARIDKNKGK